MIYICFISQFVIIGDNCYVHIFLYFPCTYKKNMYHFYKILNINMLHISMNRTERLFLVQTKGKTAGSLGDLQERTFFCI